MKELHYSYDTLALNPYYQQGQGLAVLVRSCEKPLRLAMRLTLTLEFLLLQQLQAAAEAKSVCPEATSNIFSTLTFSWISPLMRAGFKCVLEYF